MVASALVVEGLFGLEAPQSNHLYRPASDLVGLALATRHRLLLDLAGQTALVIIASIQAYLLGLAFD